MQRPITLRRPTALRRVVDRSKQISIGSPAYRDRHLVIDQEREDQCRQWGFFSDASAGSPRILMAAGHGYGNVGDEAQCGACIERWRRVAPNCKITLFSPNPPYTEALHGQACEWAPRVAWYRANTNGPYFKKKTKFRLHHIGIATRILLSARMLARGLPMMACHPRESRILSVIQDHDILHISGGGFLTGKTPSRLWENCLLMRVCQILGVPYILTGHNIGVFQDRADRTVARRALRGATYIGLRDRNLSESELSDIGIRGDHVRSTCDDALLCESLSKQTIGQHLRAANADPQKPWVAVNFHHWGQDPQDRERNEGRFAEICDDIASRHQLQPVFIAMTPSDVEPERRVLDKMHRHGVLIPYSPDYKVARGVIAHARFVFTMKHHPIVFAQGEGTPVVAVALDDYYLHKNKGALDNTGHAEFLVSRELFRSDEPPRLVDRLLERRDAISDEMIRWTDEMRRQELAPYRQALQLVTPG